MRRHIQRGLLVAKTDAIRAARYRERKARRAASAAITRRRTAEWIQGWFVESPRTLVLAVGDEAFSISLTVDETRQLADRLLIEAVRNGLTEPVPAAEKLEMSISVGTTGSIPPVFGLFVTGLRMSLAVGDRVYETSVNTSGYHHLAVKLLAEVIRNSPSPLTAPPRRVGTIFTPGAVPPPVLPIEAH